MKIALFAFILISSNGLLAETTKTKVKESKEIPSKEDKGKIIEAAKSVSGETKRVLRKIGRKSMDETCTLSSDKETCDKEKAEHARLNKKEEVEGMSGD